MPPTQTNQAEKFARISKCKQTIKSIPKPENVNKQLRLSIPKPMLTGRLTPK